MGFDEFFKQADKLHFKKGDVILRPDDTPEGLYYVEEGFVRVYSFTEWGEEKLHLIFQRGEMFPIFWTFDKVPLTKYYEAFTDVAVRCVPTDKFIAFLKSDTSIIYQFMNNIVKVLEVYSSRIDNLEYTNANARFVSRLIYLAKRFGEKREDAIVIRVPITHRDIASSIAMTRETASRVFSKLVDQRIIGYENHLIVIYDMKKLKDQLTSHGKDKKL